MSEDLLSRINKYTLKPDPKLRDQIVYEFSNMTYAELQRVFIGSLHLNRGVGVDLMKPLTDEMEKRQMRR